MVTRLVGLRSRLPLSPRLAIRSLLTFLLLSLGASAQLIDLQRQVKNQLPIANGGCNATTAAQCLLNIGGIGPSTVDNLSNKTLFVPRLGSYPVAGLPSAVTAGIGSIAAALDSLTVGDCTVGGGGAVTLCRSNGFTWSSFGDGNSGGGGGGGAPFRSTLFSSSTTWSLSQATHGEGTINAVVCRDPSLNTFTCAAQDDGSGNITVRHGVATTGYLDVFGSGGGGGGGGGGAPTTAQYILQVPNGTLTGAQALSVLATGLMKNTFATGVVSIATGADLPLHATRHQNGGNDEVATATPAANAIPKAGAGGTIAAGWLPLSGVSGAPVTIGGISGSVISVPVITIDTLGRITGQSVTSTQFVRTTDTPTTVIDVSGSFGSGLTVVGIGGTPLSPLGTGILKITSGVPSLAVAATVISLWTGPCNSSNFFRGDGVCSTPAGGGTVSSTGVSVVGNVPSWNNTLGTQLAPGYAVSSTAGANTLVQRDGGGSIFGNTVQAASYITAISPADNLFAGFFRRHSATQTEQIAIFANEFGTALSGINPDGSFSGNSATASTLTTTLPAIKGGTGNITGPSGGVLYWSSVSTISASAAITANEPAIGGGTGGALSAGSRSGNTTQFATWAGAATGTRCVHTDASGNLTIAAADCGSGSGNVNVPSATTIGNYPAWTSIGGVLDPVGTVAGNTGVASTLVKLDANSAAKLYDKGGQVFNCSAYGMSSAATAANNSTAWTNCYNAATATGGRSVMELPDGLILISTAIIIGNGSSIGVSTVNNLTVRGRGMGGLHIGATPGTMLKYTGGASGYVIFVSGPIQGIHIERIAIDSNSTTSRAIEAKHCIGCKYTDLEFQNHIVGAFWTYGFTGAVVGGGGITQTCAGLETWENIHTGIPAFTTTGGFKVGGDTQDTGGGGSDCGYSRGLFRHMEIAAGSAGIAIELRAVDASVFEKIYAPSGGVFLKLNKPTGSSSYANGSPTQNIFLDMITGAGFTTMFDTTNGPISTTANTTFVNWLCEGCTAAQANAGVNYITGYTTQGYQVGTFYGPTTAGATNDVAALSTNNNYVASTIYSSGAIDFKRDNEVRNRLKSDYFTGFTMAARLAAGPGATTDIFDFFPSGMLSPLVTVTAAGLPSTAPISQVGGFGAIAPGSMIACTDCTVGGTTCAASGGTVGVIAQYWGGAWRCNR